MLGLWYGQNNRLPMADEAWYLNSVYESYSAYQEKGFIAFIDTALGSRTPKPIFHPLLASFIGLAVKGNLPLILFFHASLFWGLLCFYSWRIFNLYLSRQASFLATLCFLGIPWINVFGLGFNSELPLLGLGMAAVYYFLRKNLVGHLVFATLLLWERPFIGALALAPFLFSLIWSQKPSKREIKFLTGALLTMGAQTLLYYLFFLHYGAMGFGVNFFLSLLYPLGLYHFSKDRPLPVWFWQVLSMITFLSIVFIPFHQELIDWLFMGARVVEDERNHFESLSLIARHFFQLTEYFFIPVTLFIPIALLRKKEKSLSLLYFAPIPILLLSLFTSSQDARHYVLGLALFMVATIVHLAKLKTAKAGAIILVTLSTLQVWDVSHSVFNVSQGSEALKKIKDRFPLAYKDYDGFGVFTQFPLYKRKDGSIHLLEILSPKIQATNSAIINTFDLSNENPQIDSSACLNELQKLKLAAALTKKKWTIQAYNPMLKRAARNTEYLLVGPLRINGIKTAKGQINFSSKMNTQIHFIDEITLPDNYGNSFHTYGLYKMAPSHFATTL